MESVNVPVYHPLLEAKKISLFMKRDDLLHPIISGNKFRKLKYNLIEAKNLKATTLVTFGGAFSNHIVATAAAACENGFAAVGYIRGDELALDLENVLLENPTLAQAAELGMTFEFLDRTTYRLKNTPEFLTTIQTKYPNAYIIPEGGTNALAVKGATEILTNADAIFDLVCCAMGTGGTAAGIINSLKSNQELFVFPALKGSWMADEITALGTLNQQWKLVSDYHFGGYAKISEELINFVNHFKEITHIPLDPIYTGKMMFGLFDLIKKDIIKPHTTIVAIHTGGLQGIVGMNKILSKKGYKQIQ